MKSALGERLRLLGPEAQDELVEYAIRRLGDLRGVRDAKFDLPLTKFARIAASEFGHRRVGAEALPEDRSIFDRSNVSTQIVRSVARFLMARISKDSWGAEPWLSVTPEGPHDNILASEISKYGAFKLRQCGWKESAKSALQTALDLGFCPVKTTWRKDWDVSETLASLLFDAQSQQPIVTQGGDYLHPDDDTQPLGADADGAAAGDSAMGADGAGDLDAGAPLVFAKAPEVPVPTPENGLHFKDHLVLDRECLFSGLDFSPLHWKDVVWPINAASMDLSDPACDFIAVTSDMTLEQLRATFDPEGDNADVQAVLDLFQAGPTSPQSEGAKPKLEQREMEVKGSDDKNPSVKITECYFRRRVLPDGPESRIFLVLAETHQKAVWVEYLAKISPRAQAPVQLVAINRVPGRAYGRGLYETYEMAADTVDRLINGVIVRNEYHANPVNFIDQKVFDMARSGQAIPIGPGLWQPIDLKGIPIGDAIKTIELPDMDERSWQLLELFMQLIQTESGVTNANQGDLTDLPSNNTATGVNSLLESSSVLHQFVLEEARSGLTPALRLAIELLFFCQDADETYEYLQGDDAAIEQLMQAAQQAGQTASLPDADADAQSMPAQSGVMTLAQARSLANLPMNVQILLSRSKRQELKEAAVAAIPYVQQFFALPPTIQLKLRDLFITVMQGLGLDNPDRYFPSPREIAQQMLAAQSQQAYGATESVSINYKDAPDDIRRQMEKEAGYTPSKMASAAPAASNGSSAPVPEDQPSGSTAPGDPSAHPTDGFDVPLANAPHLPENVIPDLGS